MRILLALSAILALALAGACDSPDISDYEPISVRDSDAAPPEDGGGGTDAPPSIDASVDAASDSEAQMFCDRYDSLCPYGGAGNWFADEGTCLSVYDTFDAGQVSCVNGKLDDREAGGGDSTCAHAAGSGPCG